MAAKTTDIINSERDRFLRIHDQLLKKTNKEQIKHSLTKLKLLLDMSLTKQIINVLKRQSIEYCNEQKKIEDIIFNDFSLLEQDLKQQTQSPIIRFCLDISIDENYRPKDCTPFEWRRAGYLLAFKYLYKENNTNLTGLRALTVDNDAKNFAEYMLETQETLYLRTKNTYEKRTQALLQIIHDIKNNKDVTKSNLLIICDFFIEEFTKLSKTHTLPIFRIGYLLSNKTLKIKINDDTYISFKGERANILHKLLKNNEQEFEDLINITYQSAEEKSKKNDILQKQIKEANTRIAKKYHNYGIISGINDLFVCNGYNYCISSNFASHVEKLI